MLDSVIRGNKKCYPQALLEECNCEIKNNKMESFINDYFDTISSDESDNESDSEPDSVPDSELDNDPDNESDHDESND